MVNVGFAIEPLSDGANLVRLSGSLDVSGATAIEHDLRKLVFQDVHVIIDLSQVTFISSQGIRVLVATAKGVSNKGLKMVLVGATPTVRKVLNIMSINKYLPIFDDLEEMKKAGLP